MPIVEALRKCTDLFLDVHLMISKPAAYVTEFAEAGADSLTIHLEAVPEPAQLLHRIREAGLAAGLAINPATPLTSVAPYQDDCDVILIMSVVPGFGGQRFEPIALEKLQAFPAKSERGPVLEIDGGVNSATIMECAAAGAEWFVVGSAIFGADDYGAAIGQLQALSHKAPGRD
jgi:ribulose-phosphate 3-epimerase